MNKETRHAVKGGGDISSARDKLSNLPNLPGVYLFKDDQQSILYIGKSKSIRNRVRSYFNNSAKHNLRIQLMVSRIHDFSLIVTDTEAEALILEEQLIKRHHPRYNVALKDGKSYPYCKLTVGEMYPRLMLVREKIDAKSEYYGPYPSVKDARQVLKAVMTYFPLRTSKMLLDGKKTYRPCLNFQMKRCLAPCRGVVSVEEYGKVVRQVRLFLKGRDKELLRELEQRMEQSSKKLEYEKSAQYRDQIRAMSRIFERQMVLDVKGKDQDVFNLFREADSTGVQVLFIRNGRLLGTDFSFLRTAAKHPQIIYWDRHCIEFICRKAQLFPVKYYCPLSIQIENCLKMHSIKNRNGAFTLFVLRKDGKKNLSQWHTTMQKLIYQRSADVMQKTLIF